MATRGELEAAAAAGLLSTEQVGPLADFLAKRGRSDSPQPALNDEENLRFIRNFHDVFLATGIVLLAVGLTVSIAIALSNGFRLGSIDKGAGSVIGAAMLFAAAAAIMWALGEIFARRRRLFLPAIALCVAFTIFAAVSIACIYIGALAIAGWPGYGKGEIDSFGRDGWRQVSGALVVAAMAATAAPALFYARFRLPFSLGLVGAGGAATLLAIFSALFPNAFLVALAPLLLLSGIALFIAGVAFDMRDPERATRLSDNGFWLHMAAAPLILNGALGCVARALGAGSSGLAGALFSGDTAHAPAIALAALAVIALLAFVSLLINRRALIVSALLTTGVAVSILLRTAGMESGGLVATTLVTLGAGVLVLGAGWRTARRALLARMPQSGFWSRVFPPEALE